MPSADQQLVDALDDVWASMAALGAGLTDAEWKAPTECPGWSVQDNLAHVVAIESTIMGRPPPDHEVADLPHVRNDVGRSNEVWVDWYRLRAGPEVLEEFRTVTAERLTALRAMDDAGFGSESWTPVGPGTVRDLLPFRAFDSWVHEQDMRRAVRQPGHTDGPAADLAFGRLTATMPYVVAKKAQASDGTRVVFAVNGRPPLAIGVDGGRARALDAVPASATTRLAMDFETFLRLCTGRGDRDELVASGAVRFTGDEQLGRRIVQQMNFLF